MSSESQQVQQVRDPPGVVSTLLHGTTAFAKRNKAITGSYLAGLLLLAFGTGFRISEEGRAAYQATLSRVDEEGLQRAHQRYYSADELYRNSQGWFWSCDQRCQHYKQNYDQAKADLNVALAQEKQVVRDAKKQIGIFSEYGVQETRDVFWQYFAGGRQFGQRQTMWDLIFAGFRWGRDEELFTVICRWLIELAFNFTIGLVMALVGFLFGVWGVISSYQPGLLTGLCFYSAAAITAISCVATYLICLYGATAGSIAVVAKVAVDHNRRIGQDPRYAGRRIPHRAGQGFHAHSQ